MQLGITTGMLLAEIRREDVISWSLYFLPIVVVGVGGLIWAAFIRSQKKRRRKIKRPHTWQLDPEDLHNPKHGKRSLNKRRRHSKPTLNPTLSETGGLPPTRPEEIDRSSDEPISPA